MAAWTLTDLKAKSLTYYKDRTDLALYMQDGVDFGTAFFNQTLRVREMMTAVTLTNNGDSTFTLPSNFIEFITILEDTSFPQPVSFATNIGAAAYYLQSAAGLSVNYTLTNTTLKLYPATANSVSILYYAKIPDLVDATAETNWLLTKFPVLYLDYCRMWAADIAEDPQNEQKYMSKVQVFIDALHTRDQTSRYGRVSTDLSDEVRVP